MSDYVLHLRCELTLFTPAEVEQMQALSTVLQRDWRHRFPDLMPKPDKHSRFDMFDIARMMSARMFSDQGKGPAIILPHGDRIARHIIKTCLVWEQSVWSGISPWAIYDMAGKPSVGPREWAQQLHPFNFHEVADWLSDYIFASIGITEKEPWSRQVIVWPTNELTIEDYNSEHLPGPDGEPNPRFDGPASVLDAMHVAAKLARVAPRPFITIKPARGKPTVESVASWLSPEWALVTTRGRADVEQGSTIRDSKDEDDVVLLKAQSRQGGG